MAIIHKKILTTSGYKPDMKYKPFNHADTKILIFFFFFFFFFFGFISGDWKLPKSLHFWILNFRFLFFIFWQNLAKDKEKKRLPLWLDDDDDDYYYYCYFLWSQWDVWSLVGSGIPLSGSDHQLHLLNPKPYQTYSLQFLLRLIPYIISK